MEKVSYTVSSPSPQAASEPTSEKAPKVPIPRKSFFGIRLPRRAPPKNAEPPLALLDEWVVFRSNRLPEAPAETPTEESAASRKAADQQLREPVQPQPNVGHSNNNVATPKKAQYTGIMDSTLDIYTQHFDLKERPFSLTPDPDYMFWSSSHSRAYSMLEYGILTRAPITLVTGEVGSGKTTLLHHLLHNIGGGVKIGLISNAHGSRGELLQWVLMSLDQPAPSDASYVTLFDAFQKYLIEEYAAGNRVILIFDEAQNLSRESLEELRMFTNINSNKDVLLQLVLVGQPELRDIVRRPDLHQFAQRVAASFHLETMDFATTCAYIGHRLRVADSARNIFPEKASHLVYQATGGVPRLVNQLCDLAMVYAFTKGQKTVTETTVQQVLDDGAFFGAGSFGTGDGETK